MPSSSVAVSFLVFLGLSLGAPISAMTAAKSKDLLESNNNNWRMPIYYGLMGEPQEQGADIVNTTLSFENIS